MWCQGQPQALAGARVEVPPHAGESLWVEAQPGWDSPVVKAAINDGVVHGGAHGEPEERQVDLLDKLVVVDVLLEGSQDEVEVVG